MSKKMIIRLKKLNNLMDIFEDYILAFRMQNPDSYYKRTISEVDDGTIGLVDFCFSDYTYFCNDFRYSVGITNDQSMILTFLDFDIFLDFENRNRILNSVRSIDATSEIRQKTTWLQGKRLYSIRVHNLNTAEKIKTLFDIIFEGGRIECH